MLPFLYDVPNLFGIWVVIFISFRLRFIPNWIALTLSISALTPFFLNDFMFPATYMSDQFKYFSIVQSLRSFSLDYTSYAGTVEWASWFLAFIPLPFIETIKSLGFYNRLIFTILVIWLYSSKKLRGLPLVFLLFYPSFLLYSSLSLRDMLIITLMIVPLILMIDGKVLKALLFSLPLYFLKFQNFFLVLIFIVFYALRKKDTRLYQFRRLIYVVTIMAFLPFLQMIIELFDYYRLAMFAEDGGDMGLYIPIQSVYDFMVLGFQSAPYFLMKPFLWEANNPLQLIQSIENVLLFVFLVYLFYRGYKVDSHIAMTWLFYLFIAMTVYGLVVFNYGTAVRYKFPFIVFVVIGLAYDLHKKYGVSLRWNFRWK
jgi:hypothetical protein